jgi:hypothetical protein
MLLPFTYNHPHALRTMSSPNIAYPPAARARDSQIDHELSIVPTPITSSQPRAAAPMTITGGTSPSKQVAAERLRGGCVPCPVCISAIIIYRSTDVTGNIGWLNMLYHSYSVLLLLKHALTFKFECALNFIIPRTVRFHMTNFVLFRIIHNVLQHTLRYPHL